MTKQELILEYTKCALDIEYFAEKYCKVWNKKIEQFVPFKLLPQQIEVINAYIEADRVLIAKYRQGGITTVTQLYLAHCLVFRSNISVGVAANKLLLARDVFAGIKSIIEQLPDDIFGRKPTDKNSQTHVIYNNGAQLMAFAASKNGVRGFKPDILFIDEAAFLDEGPDFMKSANGTMASGGKLLLNSTPNGMDLVYYATYEAAKNKAKGEGNGYRVVEINWYDDPRYNEDLTWVKLDEVKECKDPKQYPLLKAQGYRPTSSWFRSMCAIMNNDPRTIAQELENKFLGSGGHLVNEETITRIEHQIKEPNRTAYSDNFWFWDEPNSNEDGVIPGYKYHLTVDVAKGTGDGDYSTIQIFREDHANFGVLYQVAEFQGRVPLEVLSELAYKYAVIYNNAYTVVDISGGWGIVVIKFLVSKGYKNLHYDKPRENDLKVQMKDLQRGDKIPGFTMSNKMVRDFVVREFERKLREQEAVIYSRRTLSEIKTFVFNASLGRYDHMRSAHDDLLMACAMLFGVYMQSLFASSDASLYLHLAKCVLTRKGDAFLDDNRDFQEKMMKEYDMVSQTYNSEYSDDWYKKTNNKKVTNPYIYVR